MYNVHLALEDVPISNSWKAVEAYGEDGWSGYRVGDQPRVRPEGYGPDDAWDNEE